MSPLQALLLGLVQGLTEILPVSSDGHLALVQWLIQTPAQGRLALTAALHLGTGLCLIAFFWRRIWRIVTGAFSTDGSTRRENWTLVGLIALATVPAVAAAFLVEDRIAGMTSSMTVVGLSLLANGALLFATRYARNRDARVTLVPTVVIGLIQVAALLPGVSRAATTISAALFLGVAATEAFEFSFLLAIPATIGAGAYELLKMRHSPMDPSALAIGIVTAFIAGIAALFLLKRAVSGRKLWLFSFYCWVVGLAVLLLLRPAA